MRHHYYFNKSLLYLYFTCNASDFYREAALLCKLYFQPCVFPVYKFQLKKTNLM